MDRSILWRAALAQVVAVAAVSLILAVTLPHSFFGRLGLADRPGGMDRLRRADCLGAPPEHPRRADRRRAGGHRERDRGRRRRPLARGGDRGRRLRRLVRLARPPSRRRAVDLGLEGRTALVMGASRGIGRGIAGALAREGARVAIASRSRGRLERPRRRFEGVGPSSTPTPMTSTGWRVLPDEVEAAWPGRHPGHQHGRAAARRRARQSPEEWERPTDRWCWLRRILLEAVVAGMRKRGWGRIVNVGSTSVREPIPYLALSNAHRMATVGLLKTLANEVAGEGITVNTVATGQVRHRSPGRPGAPGGRGSRATQGSRPSGSGLRTSTATWSRSCARIGPAI